MKKLGTRLALCLCIQPRKYSEYQRLGHKCKCASMCTELQTVNTVIPSRSQCGWCNRHLLKTINTGEGIFCLWCVTILVTKALQKKTLCPIGSPVKKRGTRQALCLCNQPRKQRMSALRSQFVTQMRKFVYRTADSELCLDLVDLVRAVGVTDIYSG